MGDREEPGGYIDTAFIIIIIIIIITSGNRKVYFSEGSQAVSARPSDRSRLETR
jgi:hypothetical protein